MGSISIYNGMSTIERNRFQQMAAFKLKDIDFEAYQECIDYSKRKIDDPALLEIVMNEIIAVFELKIENYKVILATCYYIIAPFKILYKELKIKNGFREVICKSMGFVNAESVSMHSQGLDVYYKNPRFKEKVHQVGDRIYNDLINAGYIERNKY